MSLHPTQHLIKSSNHYDPSFQTFKASPKNPTAKMQFTVIVASLLSLTSAAAVTKRYEGKLVARQSGVCGAISTPLCCQLDVLGVANLNCENGTSQISLQAKAIWSVWKMKLIAQ